MSLSPEQRQKHNELTISLGPIVESIFEMAGESQEALMALFVLAQSIITGMQTVNEECKQLGEPTEKAMQMSSVVTLALCSTISKMAETLITNK